MAEMDLLQSAFYGKIGALIGRHDKGQNIVQTPTWGKKPPSEAQTLAVRSFEYVNRFASTFAKMGFSAHKWNKRKMHRHNALAQELYFCARRKPPNFNMMQFWDNIPPVFEITKTLANPFDETVQYVVNWIDNWKYSKPENCAILIYANSGRILNFETDIPLDTPVTSRAVFEYHETITICAIYYTKLNNNLYYHNFSFQEAINMQVCFVNPIAPTAMTAGDNILTYDQTSITNPELVSTAPSGLYLNKQGLYLITGAYILGQRQLNAADAYSLSLRSNTNAVLFEQAELVVTNKNIYFKPQTAMIYVQTGSYTPVLQQSTNCANALASGFLFGTTPLRLVYLGDI